MSRPVDERIVAMKMDNSDFAAKAAETTGIMGKITSVLNKIPGVNIGGAAKGLNAIDTAAVGANGSISNLGGAVNGIASRFSNLGIVGMTALQNITNRAVDMGVQLGKSLTTDQVMSGFQEYELKMKSIQTILANTQSKGTTLDDVNASLNELNDYADKTIYNFAEMTRNIGLFTNAGLGLEESTSMIKGFSNAAASSGAGAQEAARAAYQLSQGLSSGYIMQMDWMSLTNAGMGGELMKKDLIAIGKAMGAFDTDAMRDLTDDEILDDWKNLLSDGKWLTSDVMSTYLQAMAGDMDKAQLSAIGLTEAQADLLLQNAKTGEESATYVRTFTQLMDTMKENIGSGWAQSFELMFGDFEQAGKLFTAASKAVEVYANKSTQARNEFIKGFIDAGGKTAVIESISNIFKGLVRTLGVVRDAFQRVFPPISAKKLAGLAKDFAAFTKKLILSEKGAKTLGTIFEGLFSILGTVVEIAKVVGKAIKDMIPEGTSGAIVDYLVKLSEMSISFRDSVKAGNGFTSFIKSLGTVLKSTILLLTNFSKFLGGVVVAAFTGLKKIGAELAPIFEGVGSALAKAAKGLSIEDLFAGGFIAGMLIAAKSIKKVSDDIGGFFESVGGLLEGFQEGFGGLDGIADTIEGVSDALGAMTTGVRVFTLLQIAIAVGILAVSMKMIADLPAQDIFKSLEVIGLALAGITWALLAISKFDFTARGTFGASVLLISMANALLILSVALKVMSTIKPKEMITALGGLVVTLGALVIAVGSLAKAGPKVKIGAITLMGLATSIVILAGALKMMSQIKATSLIKSLGALSIVFAQIAIFLKVANGAKLNPATALSMNLIATSIMGIVGSIYLISGLDANELVKGLVTIAAILIQIALFSKVVKGPGMVSAAIGMNLIATALMLLVKPITAFSKLSLKEIAKGLGTMAGALLLIVLAMAGASGGIVGAIAIVAIAGALQLLVPQLLALSKLSLKQVGIGLLALAGAFTVIGLAAVILGTVAIVPLALFAAALLTLGLAMAGIGLGLGAIAAALTALAAITAASIAAIVGSFVLLLKGIASAIPEVIKIIKVFLLGITGMFAKEAPKMVTHILTGLLGIIQAIADHVPQIVTAATNLMIGFSEAIRGAVPDLVNEAVKLIITFIQAMADTIHQNHDALVLAVYQLMIAVLEVVVDVLVEIVNVLFGWIPGVEAATGAIGEAATNALDAKFKALETGQKKGKDFAGGVSGTEGDASGAGSTIAGAAQSSVKGMDLLSVGSQKGSDFAGGLGGTSHNANISGINIAKAGQTGAGSVDLTSSGTNFGLGFANGIGSQTVIGKVASAALSIAKLAKNTVSAWLDEHSPSKVMEQSGIFFSQGFANGIIKLKSKVSDVAQTVAAVAQDGLNGVIEAFDPGPDDNEIHFKAVVDYEQVDPNRFGNIAPMKLQANLATTNGLVAAARAEFRQNRYNDQMTVANQPSVKEDVAAQSRQPIVIQSVLNGRVIAEETIDDISELQEMKQMRVNRARGDY